MAFYDEPLKAKKVFIIFLVLSIVFFLGCGVLGYLFYKEHKLVRDKDSLITQKDANIATLQKELDSTSSASSKTTTNLSDTNKALENQIKSYKAKISKANAYNEFFKYLTAVISAHGGFSGWTDGEFQTAKEKAEATGDASFISTVNWAWYETSVDPTVRVIRVWNEIGSGIENALK